jgi:hypothetical protein
MRRGVECRAGGTGAESGGSHQRIRSVFTGDFGKPARHPPRKQYSYTTQRADTAVRPYAEDSYPLAIFQRMMRRMMNRQTYQRGSARRGGMSSGWYGSRKWCQPSKYKISVHRRLRQTREASTSQAILLYGTTGGHSGPPLRRIEQRQE